VQVYYCSPKGLQATYDREFGVELQWDLPLLEGYSATFLPNRSATANEVAGFWSLRNWAIVPALWQQPRSYVIVHGWNYFTHIMTIVCARLFGHKVCLRAETPLPQELLKAPWKRGLRQLLLGWGLFPWVDYCLYIGQQNWAFYTHYGVAARKLIFMPYSVDNARFQHQHQVLQPQRSALRQSLQIPDAALVILYSGKYIPKKRPLDLLRAFAQLQHPQAFLVMVGEGALRPEMENFIQEQGLSVRVLLTGFVNQQVIAQYYTCADAFVMCSEQGETWGLSSNEAMNFGLPLILSDLTGSAADLVDEGQNGYIYPTGDVAALQEKLESMLHLSSAERQRMGAHSLHKIAQYSYERIAQELDQHLPFLP
jgi:glycosyltransferase involved in cell wall biosynthesis